MDLGVTLFYQPIYNLLIVFYRLFGNNLGLAIIAIALLFRLITFPITKRQNRMLKDNQELSEKVEEIKKKYKNDQQKQTEEMMKVQSQYLPGQMSGCLSMILQFVMIINVFNVVRNLLSAGSAGFDEVAYSFVHGFGGEAINTSFLGIQLTQSASGLGYDNIMAVLPYVLLALSVGIVQFFSTRMMMSLRKNSADSEKESDNQNSKKQKDKDKDKSAADAEPSFAEAFQQSSKQTAYIMPVMITFMSLGFPAGLSIYWTAQSTFVIIQQLILDRVQNNEKD